MVIQLFNISKSKVLGNIRFGLNIKTRVKFQMSLSSASANFLVENMGNYFKGVIFFRKCARVFIRFIAPLIYNSVWFVFSFLSCPLSRRKQTSHNGIICTFTNNSSLFSMLSMFIVKNIRNEGQQHTLDKYGRHSAPHIGTVSSFA